MLNIDFKFACGQLKFTVFTLTISLNKTIFKKKRKTEWNTKIIYSYTSSRQGNKVWSHFLFFLILSTKYTIE